MDRAGERVGYPTLSSMRTGTIDSIQCMDVNIILVNKSFFSFGGSIISTSHLLLFVPGVKMCCCVGQIISNSPKKTLK